MVCSPSHLLRMALKLESPKRKVSGWVSLWSHLSAICFWRAQEFGGSQMLQINTQGTWNIASWSSACPGDNVVDASHTFPEFGRHLQLERQARLGIWSGESCEKWENLPSLQTAKLTVATRGPWYKKRGNSYSKSELADTEHMLNTSLVPEKKTQNRRINWVSHHHAHNGSLWSPRTQK